jgi:hypothetical protein
MNFIMIVGENYLQSIKKTIKRVKLHNGFNSIFLYCQCAMPAHSLIIFTEYY